MLTPAAWQNMRPRGKKFRASATELLARIKGPQHIPMLLTAMRARMQARPCVAYCAAAMGHVAPICLRAQFVCPLFVLGKFKSTTASKRYSHWYWMQVPYLV